MSRLRVAYVAHSVDPRRGGMELVSSRLIEGLADRVEFEVVASDGLETLPSGVRRTRVPIPDGPSIARLVAFDAMGSMRMPAIRRRNNVVHTCGAVVHAGVDLMTLHLSHVSVIEAQGGATPPASSGARAKVRGLRRQMAASLERWALDARRTRSLAAVSQRDTDVLAARYPALDVLTIENGVDLDRFTSTEREPHPDDAPLRVVVVAGDFERKRVALAIRAVARTARCELRVVGDGDVRSMRELATSLGAADRVTLVGHRDDVASEYVAADVVLSCSLHESFGLSLVEGAAAGCAIVSTDTGVAAQLVGDGDDPGGLLVRGEVEDVASALSMLDVDRGRCHTMAARASARSARFSWDAMASATLAAYEALARPR